MERQQTLKTTKLPLVAEEAEGHEMSPKKTRLQNSQSVGEIRDGPNND
jgi:hypothetical protein